MATLPSSFFLLSIRLITLAYQITKAQSQSICETTCCDETSGVSIRFPFSLTEVNESRRCGAPGFELTCNKRNQTLLNLPESGNFAVKIISYGGQTVWINDADECLPRRIMLNRGLSLAGSPFQFGAAYNFVNYSFFNCPSNITSLHTVEPISCLSSTIDNISYSVIAVLSNYGSPPDPISTPWASKCHLISIASVPIEEYSTPWPYLKYNFVDIRLQWNDPDCQDCEARGGRCGLLQDSDLHVACYGPPSRGLSRKVKYGISLGLGIPGFLGITLLACFFYKMMKLQDQSGQARTEFSALSFPHAPVVAMGLDSASIEKYPKTQLGDSGRLPRPNDNVCSICLCEYQPKEILRTIPDCNHYFHANCVDGWLKMKAACPLCRNLPGGSSSMSSSSLPFPPTP